MRIVKLRNCVGRSQRFSSDLNKLFYACIAWIEHRCNYTCRKCVSNDYDYISTSIAILICLQWKNECHRWCSASIVVRRPASLDRSHPILVHEISHIAASAKRHFRMLSNDLHDVNLRSTMSSLVLEQYWENMDHDSDWRGLCTGITSLPFVSRLHHQIKSRCVWKGGIQMWRAKNAVGFQYRYIMRD